MREVPHSVYFRLFELVAVPMEPPYEGAQLVAVPMEPPYEGAHRHECRMNGLLWSYTPQNPLFSGYNFLSINLNVVFERGCKEMTLCEVLDFLESLICFKKSFKMSMTSSTLYNQIIISRMLAWCRQQKLNL